MLLFKGIEHAGSPAKLKGEDEEKPELKEEASPPADLLSRRNASLSEAADLSLCTIQSGK